MTNNIYIIGGGYIAKEYAKVLKSLNKKFIIIDKTSNENFYFKSKFGADVLSGGLKQILKTGIKIETAIIATPIDILSEACIDLLKHGTKNILLEKPGSLNIDDLRKIKSLLQRKKSNVYIAYNRRFYQSVIKLKKLVQGNEIILSCFVDFTERSILIEKSRLSKNVKSKMIYANSSHMFDLFFYLCGHPKKLSSYTRNKISWHPSSSSFSGSGITKNNIIFSYFADWDSGGRWKIDIRTNKRNFILQPIEELKVMNKGLFKIKNVYHNSSLDKKFKPGLYLQTKSFIEKDYKNFCSIDFQIESFQHMEKIGNYKN